MSQFLPEEQQPPKASTVAFTPPVGDASGDVALMQRVLSAAVQNPSLIPPDFMAYIIDFIQTQRLTIPIGQVFGFSQFTAQAADSITATETTASASYVILATPGPELLALPDGNYLVLHGCQIKNSSAGNGSFMAIQANGSSSVLPNVVSTDGDRFYSCAVINIARLANGSNSLVANYRVDAGTGSFATRWLFALKYGNL